MIVVLAWLLALAVLFGSRRSAVDITAVSPRLRRGLSCLTYLGLPVLVLWLAYVWFGQLPYAVSGSVTTTEILAATGAGEIFAGLLAYSVVYVLLFAAFVRLVRYFMRYGVIPVGRQRGRA